MSPAFPLVYLASQSPRRRQLLEQLGVPFRVVQPPDREGAEALEAVHEHEAPETYVRRVAALKLEYALRWLPPLAAGEVALCADTTVALGERILGKPRDADDARAMLRSLSGTTHQVLTAVAAATATQRQAALSRSRVRFAALDPGTLQRYLASGEWRGKAGAYAIQGRAAEFIAHLSGSYSGVMGLPLFETAGLLHGLYPR